LSPEVPTVADDYVAALCLDHEDSPRGVEKREVGFTVALAPTPQRLPLDVVEDQPAIVQQPQFRKHSLLGVVFRLSVLWEDLRHTLIVAPTERSVEAIGESSGEKPLLLVWAVAVSPDKEGAQ
jgi:hypothetical protein